MASSSEQQMTVIGAQTHIKGSLEGAESVRVIGRLDGSIAIEGALTVEAGGIVVADVHARSAVIHGTVVGNVTAEEVVLIGESGRVVGDVTATRIAISAGAALRGNLDMPIDGEVARTAAATPVQSPQARRLQTTPQTATPRAARPATRPAPQPVSPARPAGSTAAQKSAQKSTQKSAVSTGAVAAPFSRASKPPTTAGKRRPAHRR